MGVRPLAQGLIARAFVGEPDRELEVITALRGDDGQITGFGEVARDDTLRRDLERQAQLGRAADREAIGRGLSNTVVHGIFEAGLALDAALTMINDPAAIERISHAVEALDDTIREIRSVIFALDADHG